MKQVDEEDLSDFEQLEIDEAMYRVVRLKSKILDFSMCTFDKFSFMSVMRKLIDYNVKHLVEINLSDCDLEFDESIVELIDELIQKNPGIRRINIANNIFLDAAVKKTFSEKFSTKDRVVICYQMKENQIDFDTVLVDDLIKKNLQLKSEIIKRINVWRAGLPHQARMNSRNPIRAVDSSLNKQDYHEKPTDFNLAVTHKGKKAIFDYSGVDLSHLDFQDQGYTKHHYDDEGGGYTVYVNFKMAIDGNVFILSNVNFFRANLSGSISRFLNLAGACFKKAILVKVKWYSANFTEANLRYTKFSGSQLTSSIFARADARYANFEFCNLCRTVFCQANLNYAKLKSANLSEADLRDADLRFSDLTGTYFMDADLRGADLRNTIGLSINQLKCAKIDGARLPESLFSTIKNIDYDHLNQNSDLSKVLTKLLKAEIPSFQSLTTKELKILYIQGNKDKLIRPFISEYAAFIRQACAIQIYAEYIRRFTGIHYVIALIIARHAGLPYKPFLSQNSVSVFRKDKNVKTLEPWDMRKTIFSITDTLPNFVSLLMSLNENNLYLVAVNASKTADDLFLVSGVIEGEISRLKEVTKISYRTPEACEQDISSTFENNFLQPRRTFLSKIALPFIINVDNKKAVNPDELKTIVLLVRHDKSASLSTMLLKFKELGIEVLAVNTCLLSKSVQKLLGKSFDKNGIQDLESFATIPALTFAVRTNIAKLQSYPEAQNTFICLPDLGKDIKQFFNGKQMEYLLENKKTKGFGFKK